MARPQGSRLETVQGEDVAQDEKNNDELFLYSSLYILKVHIILHPVGHHGLLNCLETALGSTLTVNKMQNKIPAGTRVPSKDYFHSPPPSHLHAPPRLHSIPFGLTAGHG